jgi:hypothetical protein
MCFTMMSSPLSYCLTTILQFCHFITLPLYHFTILTNQGSHHDAELIVEVQLLDELAPNLLPNHYSTILPFYHFTT